MFLVSPFTIRAKDNRSGAQKTKDVVCCWLKRYKIGKKKRRQLVSNPMPVYPIQRRLLHPPRKTGTIAPNFCDKHKLHTAEYTENQVIIWGNAFPVASYGLRIRKPLLCPRIGPFASS